MADCAKGEFAIANLLHAGSFKKSIESSVFSQIAYLICAA